MKVPVLAALLLAVLLLAAGSLAPPAEARSLAIIQSQGTIGQCLHPNALPFSSRKGEPPGFQVELGEAIAKQLGVALDPIWIIGGHQLRRSGCDIVTDAIDLPEVQDEAGLKLSKPYYRTGVVLAVRPDSPITSAEAVDPHAKIGVMGSSIAFMTFNQRGLTTSAFAFEDEMLQALADKDARRRGGQPGRRRVFQRDQSRPRCPDRRYRRDRTGFQLERFRRNVETGRQAARRDQQRTRPVDRRRHDQAHLRQVRRHLAAAEVAGTSDRLPAWHPIGAETPGRASMRRSQTTLVSPPST